jgi:hypothetical protein
LPHQSLTAIHFVLFDEVCDVEESCERSDEQNEATEVWVINNVYYDKHHYPNKKNGGKSILYPKLDSILFHSCNCYLVICFIS